MSGPSILPLAFDHSDEIGDMGKEKAGRGLIVYHIIPPNYILGRAIFAHIPILRGPGPSRARHYTAPGRGPAGPAAKADPGSPLRREDLTFGP